MRLSARLPFVSGHDGRFDKEPAKGSGNGTSTVARAAKDAPAGDSPTSPLAVTGADELAGQHVGETETRNGMNPDRAGVHIRGAADGTAATRQRVNRTVSHSARSSM
jgi:hypothetical protein